MSKVKISSNLFLEVAEMKRLQKSFDDWGFKRHIQSNTKTYGIVKDIYLPVVGTEIPTADAFYVSKMGSCNDKVFIQEGVIIDQDARFVVNTEEIEVDVPTDGTWYWLKVWHKASNQEKGMVSVDTFGNVTGMGTEFTEILRGQPNFPSKIRFLNSTLGNADDYEVVSVADDFNMVIQGDFTTEAMLEFAVVGTFTPGYPVPVADELIFEYDSVNYELVSEVTLNTAPAHLINYEFYLCRVKSNGVTVTLEDKRITWWRPWGENWLNEVDRNFNNPLIGVEAVKFEHPNQPRAVNLMETAWGFRFASYTIDTGLKKMSILIGNGGKFKDTSFFASSDFNEWRLYAKNGSWRTIIDSQKSGTQIVLTLDVLDPDDYGTADELFIAPPFEMIEIRARRDGAIIDTGDQDQDANITEAFPWPNLEKRWEYNINTQLAIIPIPTVDDCYLYNLTYRYRTFEGYTDWLEFPSDPIGYYDETSFDDYGNILLPIDRTQKPYVGHPNFGFIEVCEAPDSFQNFQENVESGDLLGVNTTALANTNPVVELEVGVDKQYQHYLGSVTLSADMFIHLKTQDGLGNNFREGNFFILQIEQYVTLSTFALRIVEDFVNPVTYTELANLTANDIMYIRNNTSDDSAQTLGRGLNIRCTYNELNKWIVTYESETCPKGTIRMVSSNAIAGAFDGTGAGVKHGFWGWQIMNGNNGTVDMTDRFPQGVGSTALASAVGGASTFTITAANIPQHNHTFSGTTVSDGNHRHSIPFNVEHDGGGGGDSIHDIEGSAYSGEYTNYGGSHSHAFSGTTDMGGGSGTPLPVDARPMWGTVVYIEKIV